MIIEDVVGRGGATRPLYEGRVYLQSWAPVFKKNGRNQEGLQGEKCCCVVAELFVLA